MTVTVPLNGPLFQALSDNIGQYWTISGDIGQYPAISGDIGQYPAISGNNGRYPAISSNIKVIFISVKSVMCWVRSKSSPTGSVNYKPNMVRPCRIRTVTILLKITDLCQYRCIAMYIAQFWLVVHCSVVSNSLYCTALVHVIHCICTWSSLYMYLKYRVVVPEVNLYTILY